MRFLKGIWAVISGLLILVGAIAIMIWWAVLLSGGWE